MANEILKDGLHKIIFEDSDVQSNLGQTIIITTEDKIEICLMKYLEDLENKRSWLTPFGLLLSIVLTFLTTDFKEWIIPKETWQAIFIVAEIIFLGWLAISIKRAWQTKSIKDVLEEIKKSQIKRDKSGKIDENNT
jgi:hypothetical protein